jgi:branched-chain amino acid transport system substrate-binding protein
MAMAGVLADQSIALVEGQVKDMGGILGGREVKFIRGDDGGVTAQSVAQARKLTLDDKVTILTLGGTSAAQFTAVAEVAEELKVPYVAMATIYGVVTKKYSASLYTHEPVIARTANFLIDVVKPKTVAFLGYDAEDSRSLLDGAEGVVGVRDRLKAKGIDIIYEQYFPQDTMDFTPYLTKIKYLNPDILVTWLNNTGQAITIHKQITELGGWGSMKYFASTEVDSAKAVVNIPSSVGTYVSVMWMAGSDDPGMKAFEDAFTQKYGRLPDPALTYYYNCFWTAIKAIELAGTDDPGKVAQALRSGNLEWDSAWGRLRIAPDGRGDVNAMVAQVQEGGKLVKVWPQ